MKFVLLFCMICLVCNTINAAVSLSEEGNIVYTIDEKFRFGPVQTYHLSLVSAEEGRGMIAVSGLDMNKAGVHNYDMVQFVNYAGQYLEADNRNAQRMLRHCGEANRRSEKFSLTMVHPNDLFVESVMSYNEGLVSWVFKTAKPIKGDASEWQQLLSLHYIKCLITSVTKDMGGFTAAQWQKLGLEKQLLQSVDAMELIQLAASYSGPPVDKSDSGVGLRYTVVVEDSEAFKVKPRKSRFTKFFGAKGGMDERGVRLLTVDEGRLAETLGLRVGDVITAMDNPRGQSSGLTVGRFNKYYKGFAGKNKKHSAFTVVVLKTDGTQATIRCSFSRGLLSAVFERSTEDTSTAKQLAYADFHNLRMQLANIMLADDAKISAEEHAQLLSVKTMLPVQGKSAPKQGAALADKPVVTELEDHSVPLPATVATPALSNLLRVADDGSVILTAAPVGKTSRAFADFGMWVDQATAGVLVKKVHPNSLGSALGIWVGDTIVGVEMMGEMQTLGVKDIEAQVGRETYEKLEKFYSEKMKPSAEFQILIKKSTGVEVLYSCSLEVGLLTAVFKSPDQVAGNALTKKTALLEYAMVKQELFKVLMGDGRINAEEQAALAQIDQHFNDFSDPEEVADTDMGAQADEQQPDARDKKVRITGVLGTVTSFTAGKRSTINANAGTDAGLSEGDRIVVSNASGAICEATIVRIRSKRLIAQIEVADWVGAEKQVVTIGDSISSP